MKFCMSFFFKPFISFKTRFFLVFSQVLLGLAGQGVSRRGTSRVLSPSGEGPSLETSCGNFLDFSEVSVQ